MIQTLEELKAELRKEKAEYREGDPGFQLVRLEAIIADRKETHVEEMEEQLKKAQELLKGLASMGHSYATILVAENNELLAKLGGK